jgi:hypothetical protein
MQAASFWHARLCGSQVGKEVYAFSRDLTSAAVPFTLSIYLWCIVGFVRQADHWGYALTGLFPAGCLVLKAVRRTKTTNKTLETIMPTLGILLALILLHAVTGGSLRGTSQAQFTAAITISDRYRVEDNNGDLREKFSMNRHSVHTDSACVNLIPEVPAVGLADYVWHKKYFTREAAIVSGHYSCLRCAPENISDIDFLRFDSIPVTDKIMWGWRLALALPLEVLHHVYYEYLLVWGAVLALGVLLRALLKPRIAEHV